ncbi:MAG: HAMP domain-containing protein [Firmicutes bacterium]|nr:HAMP domain-containing protein [Bacillota bacterium]
MKKRMKSIQFNLFSSYSLIIVIITVIFVAFFYFYVSNLLRERTSASLEELSRSISQKLDLEIEKMDDLSMNVLYSNLVKKQFSDYMSYCDCEVAQEGSDSKAERYDNIRNLTDVLVAIIGPSQTVQQVNLYDFRGGMIGAGVYNKEARVDVKEKSWYEQVVLQEGKKYIQLPHKDPLLGEVINYYQDQFYISLYRVFFDQYNIQQGIVEVIQDCKTVFSGINELLTEANDRRIYIYNQEGELVYPYQNLAAQNYRYYYDIIKNKAVSKDYLNVENPVNRNRELLNYSLSAYTGWRVVVVAQEKRILSPLFSFTKLTLYGSIFILLLALGFSYLVSQRLTIPIAKMHQTINSMDLTMVPSEEHPELNSGLNELEELNRAFQQMNQKLKNSMDRLLQAQSHEMQARMLALQSQMNPHFLYNSLANISVMAEEDMNEQIVGMCENLSCMLRYISNDGSSVVRVGTELDYTEKYLACMKVRYGDKLKYKLDISEDLLEIEVPRLLIQPLVENAIKYGVKNAPPWQILVGGVINEEYWQITVRDNGPGFTFEEVQHFWKRVEEIENGDGPPGLELEGMGLLNIYMRLKLAYGSRMLFSISRGNDDGAVVTIGGAISL